MATRTPVDPTLALAATGQYGGERRYDAQLASSQDQDRHEVGWISARARLARRLLMGTSPGANTGTLARAVSPSAV